MEDIEWKPSRHSDLSLHEQICAYMKGKILNAEWTVGTRLPSQRQMASSFGVNRSTVVAALDELASLGLVAGNTGGGTRVTNSSWGILASAPTDWGSYVRKGVHHPNLSAIQKINHAEFIPGMVRLGTGELAPELLPQADMQELFRRVPEQPLPLGYEEAKGNLFLRQQLARRLDKDGIRTSPDSILIVSGALQALQLIALGLMKRGSTILSENPSYLHSLHVFQSAGMRLQGIPMDRQGLKAALLERYQKQYKGSLLYTIPTFHNPTGIVMPEERRKELLKGCQKAQLPIIEDDVYRDLWLEAPPPPPLKSMDENGDVLYLGSLSKTASPGLRIGWLAGPQAVIERLADIKMQTDYGSSSLSQWAAGEWLASGLYDQHLRKVRHQLRERRDTMLAALEVHMADMADWNVPDGGFYIWLKLRQEVPVKLLFEKALREGILLNPGHLYGQDAQACLRLSYSYATLSDIGKGISRLAALVRTM
jgi:GntR family transcriptional regulator, regulator for abcA and norABC